MHSDEHFQPGVKYQHCKKPRAGGGELPYVTNIAMHQYFGKDNIPGAIGGVQVSLSWIKPLLIRIAKPNWLTHTHTHIHKTVQHQKGFISVCCENKH